VIQSSFLKIYRWFGGEKWLRSTTGSRLFLAIYSAYKQLFEARGIRSLNTFVYPGSWTIDVGANIGYYTKHFAAWATGGGRIIAIEPDALNIKILRRTTSAFGDVVLVHEGAASDYTGDAGLLRSSASHADHRLVNAGEGTPIASFRIDDIVEQYGNPEIGLIKVDVQGSESRVLAGSIATIKRCRPTLVLEIDVSTPAAQECSRRLLTSVGEFGYVCIGAVGSTENSTLGEARILEIAGRRGYIDVIFVHPEQPWLRRDADNEN
jgi:FkbM family methyltransferase